MTLLAYTDEQGLGALQYDFADLSIGAGIYSYAPQADITADLAEALDTSKPILVIWTIATWIPNTTQNCPQYISALDKAPLGNMNIIASGQLREEYFIQHIAQASGQYSFWLQDDLFFYPLKPTIGDPIGEVSGILTNGLAPPKRGDSCYFSLQYGLQDEAVFTIEYSALLYDVGTDAVTSDFYTPAQFY